MLISHFTIITLTGDVTGSGTGSFVATIANNVVTDAKLRDSAALSVIGRSANSAGDPGDIAAAANDTLLRRTSNTLNFGQLMLGMAADGLWTYAKIQNVSATDRLLGRSSVGAGVIEEITCTAAGRALIDDTDAASQRGTLGLSTMATQSAGSVAISGGAIDGTPIGGSTPASGTFTVLTSSGGAVTLTGNAASSLTTSSGALTMTSAAAATWSTAAGALAISGKTGVNLQYDGSTKLSVATGGVSVTGTVDASSTGAFVGGLASTTTGSSSVIKSIGYSNGAGVVQGQFAGYSAQGTAGSPSGVTNNTVLASFAGVGYGATGFSATMAYIRFSTSEDWTDSAQGARARIYVTPTGTTSTFAAVLVEPNGYMGLNITPTEVLHLNGTDTYALIEASGTNASGIKLKKNSAQRWNINMPAASADLDFLDASSNHVLYLTQGGGVAVTPSLTINAASNGASVIHGSVSELITLSTSGTTTDSSANLLPANSIIKAVVARITTTITTATDWKLGDAATAARFTSANATLTSGTSDVGLNHMKGGVASDAAGPTQAAAAKVRITTTGTPGAGAIRVTVFYETYTAPTC